MHYEPYYNICLIQAVKSTENAEIMIKLKIVIRNQIIQVGILQQELYILPEDKDSYK